MLALRDIETAHEEAIARAKNPHEVASFAIAALGRRLVAEHEAITARLEALESRRALSWAGAHDIGRTYAPGDLVQRGGALWLALTAVTAGDGPGASPSWRRLADSK